MYERLVSVGIHKNLGQERRWFRFRSYLSLRHGDSGGKELLLPVYRARNFLLVLLLRSVRRLVRKNDFLFWFYCFTVALVVVENGEITRREV